MTIKEYLRDGRLEGEVQIDAIFPGERPMVRTAHTWFHAQGGGQKSDRGLIGNVEVFNVRHAENGEVDHFVSSVDGLIVGEVYPFVIDAEWRSLNARYHSAGHLIAAVCEARFPGVVAVNGHQWPGEARVEFNGEGLERITDISEIEKLISGEASRGLPVVVTGDPFFSRAIVIGEYKAIPCGGTHVGNTEQIGKIKVRSAKQKGGVVRIGYEVLAE